MTPLQIALEAHQAGHACSQAVLEAFAPRHQLDPETARRLAAGLAGGLRQGGVCGAASGAFLVLGLALGGEDCVTKEGRDRLAQVTGEFARRFRQRAGGWDCPEVLGCDLRTPEGLAQAREQGLFASRCAPAVQAAVEILMDLLPQGENA